MTDFTKEALKMFAQVIPEELAALESAHRAQDWKVIYEYIHKMKSSAVYCKAFKLRDACADLEQYLRSSENIEHREQLYQVVLDEIDVVRKDL